VALAFAVAARRVPWLTTTARSAPSRAQVVSEDAAGSNPTAAFLLPFLSILLAGVLSTAASGGFEWLYPLRFIAAAGTLWAFRKSFAHLDWSVSWFGPAMGAAVFALWIATDSFLTPSSLTTSASNAEPMPAALAASPVALRTSWLVLRVLSASVTVPIAEEL